MRPQLHPNRELLSFLKLLPCSDHVSWQSKKIELILIRPSWNHSNIHGGVIVNIDILTIAGSLKIKRRKN